MRFENDIIESEALSLLPVKISDAVVRSMSLYKGPISEIRLRRDGMVFVTSKNKNISCGVISTAQDMEECVSKLCDGSLYRHSETIREGYIASKSGIRAGVCGRAVTENGRITSVADISSICIRIPHRIPGAADGLCRLIFQKGFCGMIIFSPPGAGKTTALREICAVASAPPFSLRVAVVDSRDEICPMLNSKMSIDILSGYPRDKGIETALRTLSPQLLICDEIGTESDAEAITGSLGAGVPLIVTAHASSFEELQMKPYIKKLLNIGAFSHAVGISRCENGFDLDITDLTPDLCLNCQVV